MSLPVTRLVRRLFQLLAPRSGESTACLRSSRTAPPLSAGDRLRASAAASPIASGKLLFPAEGPASSPVAREIQQRRNRVQFWAVVLATGSRRFDFFAGRRRCQLTRTAG